jgi:hypothetical protein
MKLVGIFNYGEFDAVVWSRGLSEVYREFRDALFAVKVCLHPKRFFNLQGKINDAIKHVLYNKPRPWGPFTPNPVLPGNRSDFRRTLEEGSPNAIGAEVQFGNIAKVSDDIQKLVWGITSHQIDAGIIVVPDADMATLLDSNLATYDRVARELSQKNFPGVHLQVIGISYDSLVGQDGLITERRRPPEGKGFAEEKVPPQIKVPDEAGNLVTFS